MIDQQTLAQLAQLAQSQPGIIAALTGRAHQTQPGSVFGGHSDPLLGSFGAPTSLPITAPFNAQIPTWLASIIRQNEARDTRLQQASSQLGVSSNVLGMMQHILPGAHRIFSTRGDMMGGAYTYAQSMNPLLATLHGQSERQTFAEVIEPAMYRRFRAGVERGNMRYLNDEDRWGSALSYLGQTGQTGYTARQVGVDGRLAVSNAEKIAQTAADSVENLDSLLSVLQKVYGDLSASQLLQKAQAHGAQLSTPEQIAAATQRISGVAVAANMANANVGAVFNNMEENRARLQALGIDSTSAGMLASYAATESLQAHQRLKQDMAFLGHRGMTVDLPSYATIQDVTTQNMMRYLGDSDRQIDIAQSYLRQQGLSASRADAQNALSVLGFEGVLGGLTTETRDRYIRDASAQSIANLSSLHLEKLLPLFEGANESTLRSFHRQRYQNAGTAATFKAALETAVQTGDRSQLEQLLGRSISDRDLSAMTTTEDWWRREAVGDLADQHGQPTADLIQSLEAQPVKGKLGNSLLDHLTSRGYASQAERLKKDLESGKLKRTEMLLTDEEQAMMLAMTDSELTKKGVMREYDAQQNPILYSLKDAKTGKAADLGASAEDFNWEEILERFITMLSEMVDGFIKQERTI